MAIVPIPKLMKKAVLSALVECNYNVKAAAYHLQLSQVTVYRDLERWGLSPIIPAKILKSLEEL